MEHGDTRLMYAGAGLNLGFRDWNIGFEQRVSLARCASPIFEESKTTKRAPRLWNEPAGSRPLSSPSTYQCWQHRP